MKAFSPVRSVRKNGLSEHNLGISRSKTPVDDPMSLLYNMNDCYSKLKELVPSIPQNKKVSKMEILQHVIDYILDLQIALDSHPSIVSLHHQRPGQNAVSRTPLTTLNTDISILSLQVFHSLRRNLRVPCPAIRGHLLYALYRALLIRSTELSQDGGCGKRAAFPDDTLI
ncbi:hypothetical protein ASZ78_013177 [Callipepla squamata]|uniref:BHLH domain-containing protein n=2 Tax=Neognathae TaxID=8825 RepID=A0A226N4K7_CALSU|nr:hypothetical protein ASZ78_013177 [Callipepla squamata]